MDFSGLGAEVATLNLHVSSLHTESSANSSSSDQKCSSWSVSRHSGRHRPPHNIYKHFSRILHAAHVFGFRLAITNGTYVIFGLLQPTHRHTLDFYRTQYATLAEKPHRQKDPMKRNWAKKIAHLERNGD